MNNDGAFDNQTDGSICFAVTPSPLILQVNPRPFFSLNQSYILCVNTNGTEVLPPPLLDTGLPATDYSFVWERNGNELIGETGPTLSPTQGGTYRVTVTDITTSTQTTCDSFVETDVIESAPPSLVVNVVTEIFDNTNTIEAIATGPGDYQYSLDGGQLQDNGIFTGVSAGLHEVTAIDTLGCGEVTEEVFIVDYPRYFTPNGDGTNDRWQIEGIGSNALIYIFDRYGKLLKQLNPVGPGWDGTFNGNNMPTNDYWFTVVYNEPLNGQSREFRAHFTLKR